MGNETTTGKRCKGDQNLTEMVFILDASGSMHGLEQDTVGGFNSLIESQRKEPGRAIVSTVTFDEKRRVLHDRVPLETVAPLTPAQYMMGGCTALLDAVGLGIERITQARKAVPKSERPGKTIFVITTDGMENASRHFSYQAVAKLIEKKKKKGWEFLFLGANIDAVKVAGSMGIAPDRAANYVADEQGTDLIYEELCAPVAAYRCGQSLDGWNATIEADTRARG